MGLKSLSLALVSGIAVFLIVGAAVTEFAQSWIEFSLFLGIPVGLVTGALTAAAVYLGLADDAPVRRRRVAGSFAAFGVGFLIALVVFGWLLNIGVTTALIVSVVVALAVAVVAYLRGGKTLGATIGDDGDTPSKVT
jgi:undecaprenyl pyrophosphate phosphatase UppP